MTELIYPRYKFFLRDFPFCIQHCLNTPDDINESVLHRREFWKITYIISGSGEYLINGVRRPLHSGTTIVCHPKSLTTFNITSGSLELFNLLFLPEIFANEFAGLENRFDFFSILRPSEPRLLDHYIVDADRRIRRIIQDIALEFRRRASNYRTVIRLRLAELLLVIARRGEQEFYAASDADVVQYIQRRIDLCYQEQLTLERFSVETGIGKSRLCLLFRRVTGATIMDALRQRRLHEAKHLLETTDFPIIEICYKIGFNDLSHFYRRFSAEYEMTPAAVRQGMSIKR